MIRAALVGLGNIAWKYDAANPKAAFPLSQAGAILAYLGVELAGGCSPAAEDRQGFTAWSGGLPTFASLEEMLDIVRPDFVGICSPTPLHFEQAKLCLERGVSMLWLEKPPTQNANELEVLRCLAEEQKAHVCVNNSRRYLPQYQKLRELAFEKIFGPCRLIRVLYSPGLSRNGIHLLDQIFFLSGAKSYELLWVERGGGENPDFALRLPGGEKVSVCGADLSFHSNDISLVCDGGILSILHGGKLPKVERRVENELFPGFYDLRDEGCSLLGLGIMEGAMSAALKDLLESRHAGHLPVSSLESAMLAQRLLEDVLRGADS